MSTRIRFLSQGSTFVFFALASFVWGCNDQSPNAISCTEEPGAICTWAGNGVPAYQGNGKDLQDASLYWPIDVSFTPDGLAYIADWNNHVIRQVTAQGTLRAVVGADIVGDGPVSTSTASDKIPPGAPGSEIALNHPTDVKALPDGKVLIVCWHNHKLRTYDPATGLVLVTCGAGPGFMGDGGPAASALIAWPSKAVVTPTGEVYLLDQENQCVRKIDLSGTITTVVGTPRVAGFSGDNGPPLQAQLHFPSGGSLTGNNPAPGGGLALDSQGRIYIADTINRRIRRVDFGANIITTIAGTDSGYAGDDGPALNAKFAYPFDLDFGPDGRLYVADQRNNRIRAIDLTTGIITTVAGNGQAGFSGDGGSALDASLNLPSGVAFDPAGHLYIADTYNSRIRRVNL